MKEITLYIPESTESNLLTSLSNKQVVEEYTSWFIKATGGATVTTSEGFYIRQDNGQLDRETTYLLSTLVDEDTYPELQKVINKIVHEMKTIYNQESVLVKTVEVQADFF